MTQGKQFIWNKQPSKKKKIIWNEDLIETYGRMDLLYKSLKMW